MIGFYWNVVVIRIKYMVVFWNVCLKGVYENGGIYVRVWS